MKIRIISVGKMSKDMQAVADRYHKMIKWKVEMICLPHSKKQNKADIIKDESAMILKKIQQNAFIVTMEIAGAHLDSNKFSQIFAQQMLQSKNITFIIGGAYGFDKSVSDISNLKLSLSAMTMPHQLAKIFLLEQIYRAESINLLHPYHK